MANFSHIVSGLKGFGEVILPFGLSMDARFVKDFATTHEPGVFGNSWSYLTQAANGEHMGCPLGYCYYDSDRLAGLGYFQRPHSPTDSFHFQVIRPIGEWTLAHFEALCLRLRELSGSSVYLKKLTDSQAHSLVGARFMAISACPWHPNAAAEDDTYPELEFDLAKTLDLASRNNQVRRNSRRFQKDHKGEIRRVPYCTKLFPHAWQVVERFFASKRAAGADFSNPSDYKNMLNSLPAGENGRDYFASLLYLRDEPVAFFLADKIGSRIAGIYASLTATRRWRGLSEYLMVSEFEEMHRAGISIVNYGGSETEKLDEFKRKFGPIREVKMHWLIYD